MEQELLWKFSIDEIVQGYKEEKDAYLCVYCGKRWKKGSIYEIDGQLYDAFGAVKQHVGKEHGSAVDYLLKSNISLIGISEIQQQILSLMSEGKDDKEISIKVGIAQSTVRNHRFKLREKEKQAKLFLALMQSLEEKTNSSIEHTDQGVIYEVHQTATMVDDRYSITEVERNKTLETYMDKEGHLKQFPAKEKKKLAILSEIRKQFSPTKEYVEAEVNEILKKIYDDYPTIRRALIEYGFLERTNDCSTYHVKK